MSSADDFTPVIGALPPADAAAKLREVGEDALADRLLEAAEAPPETFGEHRFRWPFQDRAWQHTGHVVGFIRADGAAGGQLDVSHAGAIEPEPALEGRRLRVTLDRLRVADYPGGGQHRVLFDFAARSEAMAGVDRVHYAMTLRVREGEDAGVLGYPVFLGLPVGPAGVALHCYTVNVSNDDDERLISVLESDVFKAGLKIGEAAQPALAPLTELVVGVTKSLAARRRNVPVQEIQMGLDFSRVATGARLAQGSYVVMQVPPAFAGIWSWDDWAYDVAAGRLVSRGGPDTSGDFNYLVIGVAATDDA